MASENVQTFTDGNWDGSVLKAAQPVVVDFWAEWCGPCKVLGPLLERLADEEPDARIHRRMPADDWVEYEAGNVTLAVMTRASLGHTGRAIVTSPAGAAVRNT